MRQNAQASALASLNTLLGFERQASYSLLEDQRAVAPPPPPTSETSLLHQAFGSRPDLLAANQQFESARKFARGEHDLSRPTISALAAVGGTPVRADQLTPWYGAAGVDLRIPIFNGGLYAARASEADYRRDEYQQRVRDLRNRIAADVHVTYLNLQSAYERITVSDQFLQQANTALDLAQTRYHLGLSSIVELSQAQLQQTQASIGSASARYDYQSALAALRFQTGR